MTEPLAPAVVADLRRALCHWYDAHRRDLPWRRTRDPYAIWISEAMLQQTRVEAVIDHYHAFLERFPDVHALAGASIEDVEAAWSGLGYYRRARSLREAALVIVADHGGEVPADRDALLALPGIGRYTAGALLSIAHRQAEPLVDGNVARVFSRLFLIEEPIGTSPAERTFWSLAEQLVPPPADVGVVHPSHWNQGLMELGALVCLPDNPQCDACALVAHCAAHRADRVSDLPVRKPRPQPIDVALEVLVIRRGDEVLMQQRPRTGRMAGLWELPTRELPPPGEESRLWPTSFVIPVRAGGDELDRVSHSITRHRIRAIVREAAPPTDEVSDGAVRFVRLDQAMDLALTGMARKVLRKMR